MSARKSWDVERKPSARAAAPSRNVEMTRRAPTRAAAGRQPTRAAAPKARRERASPLRAKRKEKQKLLWILLAALFTVLFSVVIYVLWLPAFRVQAVDAEGPDPEGIAVVAKETLEGNQYLVLPRDSIFFIPERDIRARVLKAHPSVQAVSISATGLNSLHIKALTRISSFTWCGESVTMPADTCYEADAEGLVFAPQAVREATSTDLVATTTIVAAKKAAPSAESQLLVYGPLEYDSSENGASMIRAHVTYASALPGALKFVKAMRGLGADIGSVTLRGDEIDLHTKAGTRITYVIGKEGEAAILAATSFPGLKLNDGSIEYVDLRFQNKIYVKRTGQASAE